MNYEQYIQDDGTYRFEDGVYFNLPEDIYHSDPALGSTSLTAIAKKPCKWQYDRIRPRPKMETSFMKWGSAFHCRVLEGQDEFDRRYAIPPTEKDFPAALTNMESIKKFLHLHGQKLSGRREDLVTRAKSIEGCPPFFEDILAEWYEAHPGHEEIDDITRQEIEDAVANMQADPTLAAVMQAGSLIKGAAELSVFFTVDGVRCKCRFDYAIPATETRPRALSVDLKSFTTFKGGNDEEAAIRKVYDECYDLQAAHYLNGRKAAVELIRQGRFFGDPPTKEFVDGFFMATEVDWVWVMLRRDAGMVPVTLSVAGDDPMLDHARDIVEFTLETYRDFVARCGEGNLWTPAVKKPLRINRSVMPTYNRGIAYEQPESH